MTPAEASVIRLSAERDQWAELAVTMARAAYRDGYRDGLLAAARSADRRWREQPPAPRLAAGPTFAELEQRRGDTARTTHRIDNRQDKC